MQIVFKAIYMRFCTFTYKGLLSDLNEIPFWRDFENLSNIIIHSSVLKIITIIIKWSKHLDFALIYFWKGTLPKYVLSSSAWKNIRSFCIKRCDNYIYKMTVFVWKPNKCKRNGWTDRSCFDKSYTRYVNL